MQRNDTMANPITLALVVGTLLTTVTASAQAQTALDGSGDKPTGYSFNQNTIVASGDLPEEAYIDETLASIPSDNKNIENSNYVVQLSFLNSKDTATNFSSLTKESYPVLFVNKQIDLEAKSNGYRVVVSSFVYKSDANDWCTSYKEQTSKDCLVLQRSFTDNRVAELAEKIKAGLSGQPNDLGNGTGEPVQVANNSFSPIEQPERYMVHQFQRAWEHAEPQAGVFETLYCSNCVYKMQLRELMVSNFELPKGEVITGFDIGDPTVFSAETRGRNRLAIIAKVFGADTNIQVYSESGRVYPIYVRSLDVQSGLLPDLVFRVLDPSMKYTEVKKPKTIAEASILIDAPVEVNPSKLLANFKPKDQSEEDFVRKIPFDVGKLRFDGFKVYGSSDKKLMPSRVFRDDKHIYIQFDDVTRLAGFTAYHVFDGIDERIGTRVSGNTFIIKGVTDLLSLKSGNSYLCIELSRQV